MGEVATLAFSNQSDPSTRDTAVGFSYSYDCTNDGSFEVSNTTAATYACAYPDNSTSPIDQGAFTARSRITDKDGGFTDLTTLVIVKNVAPTVGDSTGAAGPVPL